MKLKLTLLSAALLWPTAQAAYVYVDATTSNTTLDGATLVDGTNFTDESGTGTGSTGDGLWTLRNGASFSTFEGGGAFESDGGSTTGSNPGDRESTGNLITSITLPTAGTYDIVAIFTRTNNRDIAARIGSAPTTSNVFTTSNAFDANQSIDPLEIVFDSSYGNTRGTNSGAAYLGQFTTTSDNETVEIYINGLESTTGSTVDERTQYDGVGFQLIPEPGSALLGLLGSVLLLRRRR